MDATSALYVWEWANYPRYYIPRSGVREVLLIPAEQLEDSPRGTARPFSFAGGGSRGSTVARVLIDAKRSGPADTSRFGWDALDAWFQEDEEVVAHPRNPYSRVDALRSTRVVRVELEGAIVAQSSSPVMVIETGPRAGSGFPTPESPSSPPRELDVGVHARPHRDHHRAETRGR